MKKWIKKWWFSILMFLFAIGITLWVVIGNILLASDDGFMYTLLIINCISPVLLLIIIGVANMPKEKDNE